MEPKTLQVVECDPAKYVVIDVETNGTSAMRDDLLSISLYRPDSGAKWTKLLPLEKNEHVYPEKTEIHGIRDEDLVDATPIAQGEMDALFSKFELAHRTLLHYGSLDERFVREYFKRHSLDGAEKLTFYNFKHLLCAPYFVRGGLTKDALCKSLNIEGVSKRHSGINDCILEWKLFEALGGKVTLAIPDTSGYGLYHYCQDYMVPASYLANFSHLREHLGAKKIGHTETEVFRLVIPGEEIKKYPGNITGVAFEHLVTSMLNAKRCSNLPYLYKNKLQLEPIGRLAKSRMSIPVKLSPDGTIRVLNPEDTDFEVEINETQRHLMSLISPVIDFIKQQILKDETILSQELVINEELNVLAQCDLSDSRAVLEVKTSIRHMDSFAEQIHYQRNGRDAYLLFADRFQTCHGEVRLVKFLIYKIETFEIESSARKATTASKNIERGKSNVKKALAKANISLLEYIDSKHPIKVKCDICGSEWDEQYQRIRNGKAECPSCNPKPPKQKKQIITKEQRLAARQQEYHLIIKTLSHDSIFVEPSEYTGAKCNVHAKCTICNHEWKIRADHLKAKCYCPNCMKAKQP